MALALALMGCGPGMRVLGVAPPRPQATQPFTVDVYLDNQGDGALSGTLEATVGGQPLSPTGSAAVSLPSKQHVTVQFGGTVLRRGNYVVDVLLRGR